MEITKEQVQEYIRKNFDTFFVEALAKYVKDIVCPSQDSEVLKEYREEIKQLIWEAVHAGVTTYFEEYNGEVFKIIGDELVKAFQYKKMSINFE